MELRKWDSSLTSLKRLLYAIDDDYERERHIVQFNEIMKNAGIPPTSTAMFNSICYELVSELADAVALVDNYSYTYLHLYIYM